MSGLTAKRYSDALLELSQDSDKIRKELEEIVDTLSSSQDLKDFMSNPVISIEDKKSVIEKIFAGSGAEASRRSDAHGQSPRPRPLRTSPLWRAVEQRCGRTADTVPGDRRHQKDSAAETQSARWITGLKNKINHGEK